MDRWNMCHLLFIFFLEQLVLLSTMLILGPASTVNGEVEESVSQHTEDVKGNIISCRDFRIRIDKLVSIVFSISWYYLWSGWVLGRSVCNGGCLSTHGLG
jgi:hypothetical protein